MYKFIAGCVQVLGPMIVWLERNRHHRVHRQQLNDCAGAVGGLVHLAVSVSSIIIFLARLEHPLQNILATQLSISNPQLYLRSCEITLRHSYDLILQRLMCSRIRKCEARLAMLRNRAFKARSCKRGRCLSLSRQ